MKPTVAVLGATGVYARHLIPRLTAAGYLVRALARRPEAAGVAAACGADVRVADIYDRDRLTDALAGCDIGIHLATSLPGPNGRGSYEENDRLRQDGTPIWVDACRDAGVSRVLQQSIALVNSGAGDEWADEDTTIPADDTTPAGHAITAARSMEDSIRRSGLDWIILRGGLFYGPGTGFDDDWFDRARAGTLRLPADGSDYVSLVHIGDMAAATMRAIAEWPQRRTLIVADDQPAPWRAIFDYIAASAGAAPPQPGGRSRLPSFRVRNQRAKDALSWSPFYPTYRSGLAR